MKNVVPHFLVAALVTASRHAQSLSWTKRDAEVNSEITMNAASIGGGKFVVVGSAVTP